MPDTAVASPTLPAQAPERFARPLETDVLVIGGGVAGCAVAYFLARDRVEVALIDKHDLNTQASGATAGSLHVQIQSPPARNPDAAFGARHEELVRILPHAVEEWRQMAEALDTDIELHVEGGLMVAETEDDARFLEAKIRREAPLGLGTHLVRGDELKRMAPYLADVAIAGAYCVHEGRVNPILATPAIVQAATRLGARVFRHTEATAIAREGARFRVTTPRGEIRARRLVLAGGPSVGMLAGWLGVQIPVQMGDALHMNVTEVVAPHVHHLVQHCGRKLTMKQATNGNMIVGGGWPARFEGPSRLPAVLHASMQGNLWVASRLIPGLKHLRVLRTWTGINVVTDGKPILGEVPGTKGLFVAASPIGYTMGPLTGRLVAGAMTGRNLAVDIRPFSPDRF